MLCRTAPAALRGAVFALLWLAAVPPGSAQESLPTPAPGELAPADPLFDAPLARGIELVFSDRFEEAISIFDSLQAAHPEHPGPYFYEAAALQTWMSSYRFNKYQKALEKNVRIALKRGMKLMKSGADPWLNFYMGAAYGYRAFYRFRNFNWFGAYQDSRKSLSQIRLGLKKQPTLYDAYLGLGSYNYWSTAKSIVLKLLTFIIADKREFGLQQIALAMQHGRYSRQESRLVLVTALFDYEKYDEALAVLDSTRTPGKPPILTELYLRGRLYFHFQRWPEVERIFREILRRLEAHPYSAIGYRVECQYRIARALQALNRTDEALTVAEKGLALSKKRKAKFELESDLGSYRDNLKALRRLHKALRKDR